MTVCLGAQQQLFLTLNNTEQIFTFKNSRQLPLQNFYLDHLFILMSFFSGS